MIKMNLEDLKNIIVLLALIALIGAAAAIALTDFRGEIERGSGTTTNESDAVNLIWGNNTNMTLDHDEVSVSAVYNCTAGTTDFTTIPSAKNYTVFSSSGKIQCDGNSTDFAHDGMAVCVNYTYSLDPSARNITDNGLRGIDNATEYLDTTGTIAGVAVLIGIVILAFTFVRR